MAATVVIPARYGSTRFPGKIVASETGRPLVQHVVDQVRKCRNVREILVATDDVRIAEALRRFETKCVMTSPTHRSGTDRIAEVARSLADEIIVNVQGDEPEIEPQIIDALIDLMHQTGHDMATCATRYPAGAQASNPSLVKVVTGLDGRALYFSRSPIPFDREASDRSNAPATPTSAMKLHLGIYAYRREFLMRFASWAPSPLEQMEKLEQLRALEHGASISVLNVDRAAHGIDTPEQYSEFVKRYKGVVRG